MVRPSPPPLPSTPSPSPSLTPRSHSLAPCAQYAKFDAAHFGTCPRVYCTQAKLVPCGRSDLPGVDTVKLFCPSCLDMYVPPSSRFQGVDGASFLSPSSSPSLLVGLEPLADSVPLSLSLSHPQAPSSAPPSRTSSSRRTRRRPRSRRPRPRRPTRPRASRRRPSRASQRCTSRASTGSRCRSARGAGRGCSGCACGCVRALPLSPRLGAVERLERGTDEPTLLSPSSLLLSPSPSPPLPPP